MTLAKLYRKDTQGRLRVWYMQQEDDKYRTFDGLEDGMHKASEWKVARPKNVGKKNQTTGEQQAKLEVAALYEKQLARKWHKTRECSDWKPPFPMLAEKASEFPVDFSQGGGYVQPKLDGVRCLTFIHEGDITFWSREGQQFPEFPAIKEDLEAFFRQYPKAILDGELYNHDFAEDFNGIVSAVKNGKKVAEAGILQYHVYDVAHGVLNFSERSEWLAESFPVGKTALKLVPTLPISSQAEYDAAYECFIEAGYEGMMFRYDKPYELGKRSRTLLKVKEFMADEFALTGISEGTGNYAGCARVAHLRTKEGKDFKADIKGGKASLRNLMDWYNDMPAGDLKDVCPNAVATVTFFRYTPAGIPRFGKVKAFWWNGRDL